MIAALYVVPDGPYTGLPGVDPWHEERDARKYEGPHPVVAHPPCQRWGRYWSGGPSVAVRRKLGDDGGCFKAALASVRRWGGVLEHPEASHAFKKFQLPIPAWRGGWTDPDEYGGRSCCVSQGHYGHPARKMTWLYAVGTSYPDLTWGVSKNKVQPDLGYHSAEERRRAIKTGICQRLSHRQRLLTPLAFRDLLLELAKTKRVYTASPVHTGINGASAQKETIVKLELGIMAGAESKAWLADLTKVVERMERAAGIIGATKSAATRTAASMEADDTSSDDAPDTESDDDDFAAKPRTKSKKASSFEDDDDAPATESEDDDADFTAPSAKTAKPPKAKKWTVDDVNDACKKKASSIGGKEGRAKVLSILKKNFKTESVSELKPEQYAACIQAMAV